MKLFISYSSTERDLSERLRLALEAEGHSVFVDRAELKEGEPYHEALREAVDDADALIFLVTPRSVAPGSYALTELDLAQRQWRRPGGHVLPVLVETTPMASIPPYLRSVTLLQPKGDLVAETVAAVARFRSARPRRVWAALAVGVLSIAAMVAYLGHRHQIEQEVLRTQIAAREALQREVAVTADLCRLGSHATAWQQFERIASQENAGPPQVSLPPAGGGPGAARTWGRSQAAADGALRVAREDCGMLWLRQMRVVSEKETFGAFVDRVQPVLAQGLASASGARAADLRAHLGWADFLRSRDGVAAPKPLPQYEAALRDDPGNVFAHAMWAHYLVWTRGRLDDETRRHFDAALASGRERAYVRSLQFSVALSRRDLSPYAMVAANSMRQGGEPIDAELRERLWRHAVDGPWLLPQDRPAMLAALPAAEHLATFEWLFPQAALRDEQRPLWRFCRALMRANSGDAAGATTELETLLGDLRAAGDDGRVNREVTAVLAQWRKAGRARAAGGP